MDPQEGGGSLQQEWESVKNKEVPPKSATKEPPKADPKTGSLASEWEAIKASNTPPTDPFASAPSALPYGRGGAASAGLPRPAATASPSMQADGTPPAASPSTRTRLPFKGLEEAPDRQPEFIPSSLLEGGPVLERKNTKPMPASDRKRMEETLNLYSQDFTPGVMEEKKRIREALALDDDIRIHPERHDPDHPDYARVHGMDARYDVFFSDMDEPSVQKNRARLEQEIGILKKEGDVLAAEASVLPQIEADINKHPEGSPERNAFINEYNTLITQAQNRQKAMEDMARSIDADNELLTRREVEIARGKGSWGGAAWNSVVEGMGKMNRSLFGDLLPDLYVEMQDDERIRKLGGKDKFKRDMKAVLSEDIMGEEGFGGVKSEATTQAYIDRIKKEHPILGGGILGLAESAPAMATPYMAGIFLQVSDGLNQEMAGEEWDGVNEWEKKGMSYLGGAVGMALERFGFKNLVNNSAATKQIIARVIDKVPVNATPGQIQRVLDAETSSWAKNFAVRVIGGGAAEAETGAAQEVADVTMKALYNEAKGKQLFDAPESVSEFSKDVMVAGLQEMVGGKIMATPAALSSAMSTKGRIKAMEDNQYEFLEQLLKDPDFQATWDAKAQADMKSGKMTKAQYEKTVDDWGVAQSVADQIPDGLPVDKRREAFDILLEKQKLKGKDKTLAATRVAALDDRLAALVGQPAKEEAKTAPKEEAPAKEPEAPTQPPVEEAATPVEDGTGETAGPVRVQDKAIVGRGSEADISPNINDDQGAEGLTPAKGQVASDPNDDAEVTLDEEVSYDPDELLAEAVGNKDVDADVLKELSLVAKSLGSKVGTQLRIFDEGDFSQAARDAGADASSSMAEGFFLGKDNTIYINRSMLRRGLGAHEGTHAVVFAALSGSPIGQKIIADSASQAMRSSPESAKVITDFLKGYGGAKMKADGTVDVEATVADPELAHEAVAEFVASIYNGSIKLDSSVKSFLRDLYNRVMAAVGISTRIEFKRDGDFIAAAKQIASAMKAGRAIDAGATGMSDPSVAQLSRVKDSSGRPLLADPKKAAKLKRIWNNLDPSERQKLNRASAEKLVDTIGSLPSSSEMAAVAHAGKAKRGWYENSANAIVHVFGKDAPRFAALLAATSPRVGVKENLSNSLLIWEAWAKAGKPTDAESIINTMRGALPKQPGKEHGSLGAWENNTVRALSAEDPESITLSGPKVNSFMLNLRGNVNEVTNDTWMSNYALVDQRLFAGTTRNPKGVDPGKGPGYLAMTAQTREAAKRLSELTGETWTPAEVQETVWSWAKALYEMAAGEQRAAKQIIEDDALTDELINSTPDFRTLFHTPQNEDLLKRSGYAEEISSLRSRGDLGFAGSEISGAEGKAAPFDRDTQKKYERRAAARLDERRAQSLVTPEASGAIDESYVPFSKRQPDGSLNGLPRKFRVDGKEMEASHWQPAEDVAIAYMEKAGLPYNPPSDYVKVDKDRAKRIADAYEAMKHDPEDPEVKKAYEALSKETIAQYESVIGSGLKVEFIPPGSPDPYAASPRLATEDIRDNNHMWVFGTRDGFGSSSFDPASNPLLKESGFEISGQPALVNDLFRVVHDYFGHVKEGVGFRADGEENAWRMHSSMFSPEAQRALTTETRGQNSWVNFGPHGEKNRSASGADTVYADQKTGLLPTWASEDGRYDNEVRFSKRAQKGNDLVPASLSRELTDDGKGNYVFFHKGPKSLKGGKIDPSYFGKGKSKDNRSNPVMNYYTKPDHGERMIKGEVTHAVPVPKWKVYPLMTDPLDLYDKAEANFRKDFGKHQAFDAVRQADFIGPLAADAGFDMMIAGWSVYPLRAESTKALKPDEKLTKKYEEESIVDLTAPGAYEKMMAKARGEVRFSNASPENIAKALIAKGYNTKAKAREYMISKGADRLVDQVMAEFDKLRDAASARTSAAIEQPAVPPPAPPEPDTDDEPRRVMKTTAGKRAYEGDFRQEVKDEIKRIGLYRDVETHEEAIAMAGELIGSKGLDAAIAAVRNDDIKGAPAVFIYGAAIKRAGERLNDAKGKIATEDALIEQAELIDELDAYLLTAGRTSSAMASLLQDDAMQWNAASMSSKYREEVGKDPSPEQIEEYKEIQKKMADLDKRYKEALDRAMEAERRAEAAQAVKDIRESVIRSKGVGEKVERKRIADRIRSLKIQASGSASSFIIPPQVWNSAVEAVAVAYEAGQALAIAVSKGVDKLRQSEWYKKLRSEDQQKAEQSFVDSVSPVADENTGTGRIRIPKSLIRSAVENGAHDIDSLTAAIKDYLKDEYPDATDREIRDAITDYGKTVNPSRDEIDTEIRRMRRVGRLISALEDVQAKKRPLRSGLQRDKMDAEERALNKQLRDAMRDLPMDQEATAKQMRTALDAAKARARNRIEELQAEIDSKERRPRANRPIEADEELRSLAAEKERLEKEHDRIFGDRALTIEERMKRAEDSVRGSIERYEERIKERRLEAEKKGRIDSPELTSLRARRDALRAELKTLQDEAGVTERKRLIAAKKAADRQVADLKRRLQQKDFSKKERKAPVVADDELTQIRSEKLRLQEWYEKDLWKSKLENRTWVEKAKDAAWQAWGLTRALMTTAEASFVFIQGGNLTISNLLHKPVAVKRAFKNMINATRSDERADEWLRTIRAQEWYPVAKKAKLAITEPHGELSAREELFFSDWLRFIWAAMGSPALAVDKLAGTKLHDKWMEYNPFRGLERAAVAYLDTLRIERFLDGMEALSIKKNAGEEVTDADYRDIADVANTLTGRSSLGPIEQFSKPLTKMFFSPRMWASQIKTGTPYSFVWLAKMSPTARKMALADFGRYMAITMGTVAAAAAYFNNDDDDETEVELDPRSSDFGKIRLGDTRVDPWGGKIQQVVLSSRIIAGMMGAEAYKKTGAKKAVSLGVKGESPTMMELIGRMATNKLAPSASMAVDWASAESKWDPKRGEYVKYDRFTGEEYDIAEKLGERIHPIYWDTVSELAKEDPGALEGFLMVYAFFGGGVSVYEKKEKKAKRGPRPPSKPSRD